MPQHNPMATSKREKERIGILGGSFDPVHLGHLLIAEFARESLSLDKMCFLPAAHSPLKENPPNVEDKHRLEMLQLAINGNRYFEIDSRELEREGKSFTVQTLEEYRADYPDAEVFFVIGADSLETFARWKEPERICELAHVTVLQRGGVQVSNRNLLQAHLPNTDQDLESHFIASPQIEISSSEIRSRVHEGLSIRYQLPPAVAAYIAAQDLYA